MQSIVDILIIGSGTTGLAKDLQRFGISFMEYQ
ncbi:hypothetical protein BH23BAC1_BH23BAC1_43250 [soil metagenome]